MSCYQYCRFTKRFHTQGKLKSDFFMVACRVGERHFQEVSYVIQQFAYTGCLGHIHLFECLQIYMVVCQSWAVSSELRGVICFKFLYIAPRNLVTIPIKDSLFFILFHVFFTKFREQGFIISIWKTTVHTEQFHKFQNLLLHKISYPFALSPNFVVHTRITLSFLGGGRETNTQYTLICS